MRLQHLRAILRTMLLHCSHFVSLISAYLLYKPCMQSHHACATTCVKQLAAFSALSICNCPCVTCPLCAHSLALLVSLVTAWWWGLCRPVSLLCSLCCM